MIKQFKLSLLALTLLMLTPISMFLFPSNAGAAQALVENSWRYEDGQLVAEDVSSDEDGIALLSLETLPDGVTAQGIDVSEHQGRINWDAVKASGVDFAILRVGFGAPSFGGRVDYQFNRNISECERLGIPYGVYIYSYAWDDQQAADEASMVISCLSGHNPRLPVYYDLEDNSIIANGRQAGLASRARVFCNSISAAGFKPGIYANLNWFNNILTDSVFKSSSWDHWIAQYNWRCDYTGNYSFWQYSSSGKVSGINGNVDMNYFYGTFIDREAEADALAAEHASDLPDGTYGVSPLKRADGVLDAKGGSTAMGTAVQLWESNGTDAQGWRVTHDGDYVVLTNIKSGLALDVSGGSSAMGSRLQLWEPNGTRAQRWIAVARSDGSFELRSAMDPDRVLDLVSGDTADGTRLQIWEPNGTPAQLWTLSKFQTLTEKADALAAEHASDLPDGTYGVVSGNGSARQVLDVASGSASSGAAVQVYESNATDA